MAIFGQPLGAMRKKSRVIWSRDYGRFHARNNIIVSQGHLYFSTSGREWNMPDADDAIWCVDPMTGDPVWSWAADADVNEISVSDGILLAGTDGGTVVALDSNTGAVLAEKQLDAPVRARPLVVSSVPLVVLLVAADGQLITYKADERKFRRAGSIPFQIRANPVLSEAGEIIVGTETGELLSLAIEGKKSAFRVLHKLASRRVGLGKWGYVLDVLGIQAINVAGPDLLVSFARVTYGEEAPIELVDPRTGEARWRGKGRTISKKNPPSFGNARVQAQKWRNLVLSTFAYDDSLHAFDAQSGVEKWRIRLDEGYFQNWSSPQIYGDLAIVCRVNGIVTAVDLKSQTIAWSVAVEGLSPFSRESHFGDAPWPKYGGEDGPSPGQPLTRGIAATPCVGENLIFVGTVSGKLVCLKAI